MLDVWTAIELQRPDVLEALHARGLLHAKTEMGGAVLHHAAELGRLESMKFVLERSANPRRRDRRGWSPLHCAAAAGQTAAVALLLHTVAEQGAPGDHAAVDTVQGAVARGLRRDKAYRQFLNSHTLDGDSALHLAIRNGHWRTASTLLQGSDPNAVNNDGVTPLLEMCGRALLPAAGEWGQRTAGGTDQSEAIDEEAFLAQLVGQGGLVGLRNRQGQTALHLAAANNHQRLVRALLGLKADPAERDRAGETPLHSASGFGDRSVEAAAMLIRAEPSLVNSQNETGNTPLHTAIRAGQDGIVRLLLRSKADPTITNRAGNTALHEACCVSGKLARHILAFMPSTALAAPNHAGGDTALHLACRAGNDEAVIGLIEAGVPLLVHNTRLQWPKDVAPVRMVQVLEQFEGV